MASDDGTDSSGSESTSKRLSASDVARAWGTSRAYVSKCVKQGCPLDSLDAADQWRQQHSRYGVGYRSKGAKSGGKNDVAKPAEVKAVEVERDPVREPPQQVASSVSVIYTPGGSRILRSLEESLQAAIEVETEAFRLVRDAQKAQLDNLLAIRIAAYNKARDGRMEAETKVLDQKEREKILVPTDQALELIKKVLVPLITRFRSLSRRAGPKANPGSPLHAERVLEAEVEEAIAEVRPIVSSVGVEV